MADKEVTIKVSADTAPAKANLSELEGQMKQLGQNGGSGDTTAPAGGITAEQADLLNKMQAQLLAYKTQVDELRAAYERLANSTSGASSKSSESLKALEAEVEVLKKQQNALVDKVLELQVENNRLRDAHAGAGSGAQSQASAENGLAQRMAYAAMNVRQLRQEIVTLNSARKAAAAAGDTKAYEELTAKVGAARTALRAARQARNVEKAAMMGQAAAGMQLANQVNSLAQSVQQGSEDIGGMITQVLSLGMAIKAGLGPIGWLMLAIQGLQIAWNRYSAAQEEARQKDIQRVNSQLEMVERLQKELDDMSEKNRSNKLNEIKQELSEFEKQLQDAEAERQRSARAANLEASEAAAKRLTSAEAAYQQELANVEVLKAQGGLTEEQAEQRKNAALEAKNAALEAIREESAARENAEKLAASRAAENIAQRLEEEINKKYGAFEEVLSVKLPTVSEWQELQIKLKNGLAETRDIAFGQEVNARMNQLRQALQALGIAWRGTDEELLGYMAELREARAAAQDRVKALRDQAASARENAAQSASENRVARDAYEAQQQTIAAQQEASAAARESAEAKKQEAEYNREIASELSRISGQYRVTGSYKEEDNRSAKQIRDCDRTILEAKERELRDLLARTSDAATREKIQAALDDTEKAQRALADATRQAADQEAKRLKNMAPPEFHSKNRQVDRNLKSLGKSYARYAKAAEKAAEAGDAKAMERAQKRMQYYAGRMGRASKDQEKADRMYKKDAEALEAVAEEHGKDYQRVKRAGQEKGRQEAAEARRRRRANQEAARQQRAQQQAVQPEQQASTQVDAQEVAARSQAAMQELTAQISALTCACNGIAAAASSAAGAAAGAVKRLNAQIKTLNEEVNAIREEVDA